MGLIHYCTETDQIDVILSDNIPYYWLYHEDNKNIVQVNHS